MTASRDIQETLAEREWCARYKARLWHHGTRSDDIELGMFAAMRFTTHGHLDPVALADVQAATDRLPHTD